MPELSGTLKHTETPVRIHHVCKLSNPIWGIDLIGALLTAPVGYKYCVVAMDYFSKWVEAEPLTTITSEQIWKFVWKSIICRFGCPKVIVIDNGTQFTDSNFQDFIEELGITLHFAPVDILKAMGNLR